MGILVKVLPTIEPITLSEAKQHLKIDDVFTDDDTLIEALIAAARQMAENYTDSKLINTTVIEYFDKFPSFNLPINLYFPNVSAVNSITYRANSNTDPVALDSSKYRLDAASKPCRVGLINNSYPTALNEVNAIAIEYVAGYGESAADVPALLKAAIKIIVADLYENREDKVKRLPTASMIILNQYTTHQF